MSHINTTNQLPIDKVLSKLDKVKPQKQTKKGLNQWQALCPAHMDKSPSLIITECLDHTLLLKCWAGCTTNEIVKAIGLELKDLFKYEPSNTYKTTIKSPSKQAITHEQLIVQIAVAQINKGIVLKEIDKQRYQQALIRLNHLERSSHVK